VSACHFLNPCRVGKVPLDGELDSAGAAFALTPAKLPLDSGGIHSVTAVVAGTVLDESDEAVVRSVWREELTA
jgi:hypothetical protein